MMILRGTLKLRWGDIVLVLLLAGMWGCGDEGGAEGGQEVVENQAPVVVVGGQAGQQDPEGTKYLMREDFSRHTFRVRYFQTLKKVLEMAEEEPLVLQDERVEAVMRLTPMGQDEEGQIKLQLETEKIAVELYGLRIDTETTGPPVEALDIPGMEGIYRVLKLFEGMGWTLWVDKTNRITNIIGENKASVVEGETAIFKHYFEIYRQVFQQKIAGSAVMGAEDYLMQKEVEVGQKWNIAILNKDEIGGPLQIQTECRLDEVVTEGDEKLGRISFVLGYLETQEKEIMIERRAAVIKQMQVDGSGQLQYNLQEDFASELSLKIVNKIELESEGKAGTYNLDEEIKVVKEIVQE